MTKEKFEFCEFEAEELLFDRAYCGVPYWEMLRGIAYHGTFDCRIETNDLIRERRLAESAYKKACRTILLAIKSAWNFHKMPVCDIICFTDATKQNPKDIFYEGWQMPANVRALYMKEEVDADCILWKDKYNLIAPHCKALIQYNICKIFGRMPNDSKESEFLKELENKMQSRFGKSLPAARLEKEIQRWLFENKVFEQYAEKLFKKTQCRAISVVCYYQVHMWAIYRVAKRLGIKIVEFQHGMIHYHHEYWFEDQRGKNNDVPDYMLTFGSAHAGWAKLLPSTKVIPVGSLDKERKLSKLEKIEPNSKTVVVYPEQDKQFEKVLNEFADLATQHGYRVVFKLHPLHVKNASSFFPLLAQNENAHLVSEPADVYFWLQSVVHHVFSRSTVGLEAICFAHTRIYVPQFVLEKGVQFQQLKPLVDNHLAQMFNSAEQLLTLIESPSVTSEQERERFAEAVWETGARQKIEHFFKELLT